MTFRTFCFICFLGACAGSCYFLLTYVANYNELKQYADVIGVPRIYLTMATGLNALGLCMALFMACIAGMFFMSYKTSKP